MFLNALGQPILVINSLKTPFELLDRRASIYSDRPHLIVANGTLCGGLFTASMSYGDVLVYLFIPKRRNLSPSFFKEAILLASAMLDNPDAFDSHVQRCSASATMSILYDYPTLENEHDETITQIHTFIDRMSAASAPGAYLVELFPWMIHIPERYEFISLTGSSVHPEE